MRAVCPRQADIVTAALCLLTGQLRQLGGIFLIDGGSVSFRKYVLYVYLAPEPVTTDQKKVAGRHFGNVKVRPYLVVSAKAHIELILLC